MVPVERDDELWFFFPDLPPDWLTRVENDDWPAIPPRRVLEGIETITRLIVRFAKTRGRR
jgi:hypothetical protein